MTASASAKQSPRYLEILEDLRRKIEVGELRPGERLPSFTEMRQTQSASQATMERVYAVLERERLIVRERGRGTFVSDGRALATGLIGYIGGAFAQRQRYSYAAQLVEGIEEVVRREDFRVLLLEPDSRIGWNKVDGLLISATAPRKTMEPLPSGLPCVMMLQAGEGSASVVADDYGGATQAIGHLLDLGHRRIAVLMQDTGMAVRLRLAGYSDAMRDAGIEVGADWMRAPELTAMDSGYRDWGYNSMKRWLAEDWRRLNCSAIFVQNDVAAIGVLEAFREAGIVVPDEVSVISFDGTDVCDYCNPRLTAIEVPLRDIGMTATQLLIQQIVRRETSAATTVLPTRLKPGESTAPARH